MSASPSPTPRLLIAGRYSPRAKLGSGRMGTVYLVDDQAAGQRVALKVIDAGRPSAEIELVRKEFCALASLHHAQIARAFDFGYTDDGRAFYTREYIEGSPLRPGPPPADTRLEKARAFLKPFFDLLDALGYLHAQGILHLDVHAGNLIEAADEHRGGVLIDFGFPRSRDSGSTPVLDIAGSVAPEVIAGEPQGPPADFYAVSRLLLYRLTGEYRSVAALPREIPGWGPRLTLHLERIAAKGLQVEPGRRFQSAEELSAALSDALGEKKVRCRRGEPRDVVVGRDAELGRIEGCLRAANEGQARVLWFFGVRGVGKSALLAEARKRAQLRGLDVVSVRFLGDELPGPTLLRALQSHRGARSDASSWIDVLSVDHGGSTEDRAQRGAAAYFGVDGPTLTMILDDVDGADRESRLLLEALAREALARAPGAGGLRGIALILASGRPPDGAVVSPACRSVVRALRPLPLVGARRVLAALLGGAALPAALADNVLRTSGGLPLELRPAAQRDPGGCEGTGHLP